MTSFLTGPPGQPDGIAPAAQPGSRLRSAEPGAQSAPSAVTSNLSAAEFAAIRSVGFSPVGFVRGTVVASIGWVYAACGHTFPGATATVHPQVDRQQALTRLRATALQRMRNECVALGADGVVGVCLSVSQFPVEEQASARGQGWEFVATGTAVRADGPVRPRAPFTCDLTAAQFAAMLRSGWVPVSFVQGVSVRIRHRDVLQRAAERSWSNTEITGAKALVTVARRTARGMLARDAAACGAEHVVISEQTMQVYEMECRTIKDGRDRLAEACFSGTTIVPIGRSHPHQPPAPLSIMRLGRTGA